MKNTKVKIISTIVAILLATLLFCVNSFAAVTINFPLLITNGQGKITVSGNTNNEKIYYQALSMTDSQFNTIENLYEQARTAYNDYRARFDEKYAIYQPLMNKVNNGTATQEERQRAYQLKDELEAMTNQYEATESSLISQADAQYPSYNNANWMEAVDGNFEITNTTNYDKHYVLWAKVGETIDKFRYTVSGSDTVSPSYMKLEVEVGKDLELTGVEGTDLATISWTSDDATIAKVENNKVYGLKVGATMLRGFKNGKEVIDIDVKVTSSTTVTPVKDIPSDAKTYNGHTYYYFSGNKSWDDAKAYCEKVGGYLATITTQGEADFVKTLNDPHNAWIGGYKDSDWKWVTGETWSYTNWNTNEPSSKNRAAMVPTKWGALDNNSMDVAGFICEWNVDRVEIPGPSTPTTPTDPTSPTTDPTNNETKEPAEQLIYRQDGIVNSTTNPKSTSGDNTLATKKIPQTGESILAIVAIAAVAGVAFIAFVNYRKNK